jgi:hypothetical protein
VDIVNVAYEELLAKAHECAENARDVLSRTAMRRDDPLETRVRSMAAEAATGAGALGTAWAQLGALYLELARESS